MPRDVQYRQSKWSNCFETTDLLCNVVIFTRLFKSDVCYGFGKNDNKNNWAGHTLGNADVTGHTYGDATINVALG